MDLLSGARLVLVYGHLLLCVFALHCILRTDWRMLHSKVSANRLLLTHRYVLSLLAGLWLTGLLLIGVDTGFDLGEILRRSKLLAKLVCVATLTLNGLVLRAWCFPRLVAQRPLGRREAVVLMVFGALSTTSWLVAAFFGIARPLQSWTFVQCLSIYGAALAVALPVAVMLEGHLRRGHRARAGRREPAEVAPLAEAQ